MGQGRTKISMSEEMLNVLQDLWQKGMNPISIGEELHRQFPTYGGSLSRSAILGKVWRTRRKGKTFDQRAYYDPAEALLLQALRRKQKKAERARRWREQKRKESIPDLTPLNHPSFRKEEESGEPITMINLQSHHCRWPIEIEMETLYCGKHKITMDQAYCSHHAKVAAKPRYR